jgi:hypothetical protein
MYAMMAYEQCWARVHLLELAPWKQRPSAVSAGVTLWGAVRKSFLRAFGSALSAVSSPQICVSIRQQERLSGLGKFWQQYG